MKLEWQIQYQEEDNGLWEADIASFHRFGSRIDAERYVQTYVRNSDNCRVVPAGPDPELGDMVLVLAPDKPFVDTITGVMDPDQGAFEYLVNGGGFWDRESLAVLEWLREAPNT